MFHNQTSKKFDINIKKFKMNDKIKFLSILAIGLVIILVTIIIIEIQQPINPDTNTTVNTDLKKFASAEDLINFLKTSSQSYRQGYDSGEIALSTVGAGAAKSAESAGANDYSTTNIQVAGVDEADIVKNDGKYIYTASGNSVVIVEAYPAEDMKIVSKINISGVNEIFVNKDKLVVFTNSYSYPIYKEARCLGMGCGGYSESRSMVYIYDISDRENPELEKNISADGNYVDSRMIGDYVYVVSSKYINIEQPILPMFSVNSQENVVAVQDIAYFDYPDYNYVFTSIVAIDTQSEKFENKVFLTGSTQTIFVSQDNIYLTYTKNMPYIERQSRTIEKVFMKILPEGEKGKIEEIMNKNISSYYKYNEAYQIVYGYSNSLSGTEKEDFDKLLMEELQNFSLKIAKETEKTVVHKININQGKIEYKKAGEVLGHILNQFSMDEYKGKFRIATTTGETWGGNSLNHLYVLDEDMKVVGSVEDLAEGEKIYSARFMGDRAYIVTFKKIDPLFVIDLSKDKPEVLGYLKITGYSDYLHPYDETHIIGVGKEAQGGGENFAWYQGIKVSLFDVSDVENPKEVGKIIIGDRGTTSEALSDHKAFMFDKSRNLLVLPISEYQINESKYNGEVPDNAYGEFVWQGAYVLNIDLSGISVKGKIAHDNDTEQQHQNYYGNYNTEIQRSLYMDDVLYTMSNSMIKANNLESLDELNFVDLLYVGYNYYGYGVEFAQTGVVSAIVK